MMTLTSSATPFLLHDSFLSTPDAIRTANRLFAASAYTHEARSSDTREQPFCAGSYQFFVTSRLLPRRFRFDASDEFLVVDEGMKEVAPCVGGTTSIGKHLP